MRAYLYFHLLRSWGDVILYLDYTNGASLDLSNLSKAASPAEEVMKQIKEDITASEKDLAAIILSNMADITGRWLLHRC